MAVQELMMPKTIPIPQILLTGLLALLLAVPAVAGDLQAIRRIVDGDTVVMVSGLFCFSVYFTEI